MLRLKHVWFSGTALTAVTGLFLVAAQGGQPRLDGGTDTRPRGQRPTAATVASGPIGFNLGYSTGFELAPDGWLPGVILTGEPGNVDPSLNWQKRPATSVLQPEISIANPAGGSAQHYRLAFDPGVLGGTAFDDPRTGSRIEIDSFANTNPTPYGGIVTTEWDAAMTGQASDIRVLAQDRAGPVPRMWMLTFFNFDGFGELMHSAGDANFGGLDLVSFNPPVYYDISGTYHRYKVVADTCTGFLNDLVTTTYYIDGVAIGSYTGTAGSGTRVALGYNQFITLSNNFQGSTYDMDNLSISRVECPATCGNGVIEYGETCGEPGLACNPGHTCLPVGDADECTCTRLCTLDDPCILENGANGPFTPPFDANFGAIFLYDAGTQQSVGIDTCGTAGFDTNILYWGSASDVADPGNGNDDCDESACCGGGSDPSSSCYAAGGIASPYNSCTCHDLPLAGDSLFVAQINGAANSGLIININKETTCGGGDAGACCNTFTGVCDENGIAADCDTAAGEVYTANSQCGSVTCVARLGACCQTASGVCAEDVKRGDCTGVWTEGADCSLALCPHPGACCDANLGVCNSPVFQSACAFNWTTDASCSEELCPLPPGACCTFSSSSGTDGKTCVENTLERDCVAPSTWNFRQTCEEAACTNAIPTVSEWGIAIMSLLLLVGLKVYFGRREVTA